jgi:hypothetical protein
VAFSNTSRYLLTDVIEIRSPITGKLAGKPFIDLRDRISEKSNNDIAILYDTVDGWAGLGARFLGDAKAWWVIADLSNVIDPFEELTEAKQLRFPSISRYQLNILPSDRGSF